MGHILGRDIKTSGPYWLLDEVSSDKPWKAVDVDVSAEQVDILNTHGDIIQTHPLSGLGDCVFALRKETQL